MSINVLFKYGSLNKYSEELFSTSTVWFSSPSSLNDPFECRPWITFNGSESQIVDSLTRAIRRNNPFMPVNIATACADSILREGRHHDSKTWENLRADLMSHLNKDIGLYCLTKAQDNILMWAHYAKNHEGYCLEFEATDYTPVFGKSQEVKYAEEFPVFDLFNTSSDKQVDLAFLTKFVGWKYEEEYRVVDHQEGSGNHAYPPELLRSVTFGMNMQEKEREKIRGWLKNRGHEIKLYETSIHERTFKILVTETK